MQNIQEIQYDYLDNRYKILTTLGNSEKNATFLAQDEVTGRIVVKKYLSPDHAAVYETLKDVKHQNLVPVYHVAQGKDSGLAIMEYVSGQTTGDIQEDGTLFSEEETARYMLQLMEALEAVHQRGIVHRDISPQNVLISSDGVIRILDFDIGRRYESGKNCDTEMLGTAGYAAPEQFGFAQSDSRSDIYAAGALMNQMLTGALPTEKAYARGPLGEIIGICTRMDPENRYQSAGEVILALEAFLAGKNPQLPKASRSIWPGFRSGKHWKKITASAYYILMMIYSIASVAECARTPMAFLLELLAVLTYVWAAPLLALNMFGWMQKIPGIRRLGVTGRFFLGAALWIFLVCAGFELEQFVRADMLHIASRTAR